MYVSDLRPDSHPDMGGSNPLSHSAAAVKTLIRWQHRRQQQPKSHLLPQQAAEQEAAAAILFCCHGDDVIALPVLGLTIVFFRVWDD